MKRIAASELAKLGYCETKAVLEARNGEVVTLSQAKARERGRAEHARFDTLASAHHNAGGDRRCFIASHVYGHDDPRTDELRAWRDDLLAKLRICVLPVRIYYLASPAVVRFLQRHPWATPWVRAGIDLVRKKVVRR